jgi:hypothetical protein
VTAPLPDDLSLEEEAAIALTRAVGALLVPIDLALAAREFHTDPGLARQFLKRVQAAGQRLAEIERAFEEAAEAVGGGK